MIRIWLSLSFAALAFHAFQAPVLARLRTLTIHPGRCMFLGHAIPAATASRFRESATSIGMRRFVAPYVYCRGSDEPHELRQYDRWPRVLQEAAARGTGRHETCPAKLRASPRFRPHAPSWPRGRCRRGASRARRPESTAAECRGNRQRRVRPADCADHSYPDNGRGTRAWFSH